MKDKGTSELKKLEETKAPGTLFTAAPTTSVNEAFRRVQEDPLLRMRCVPFCQGKRVVKKLNTVPCFFSSTANKERHKCSRNGSGICCSLYRYRTILATYRFGASPHELCTQARC